MKSTVKNLISVYFIFFKHRGTTGIELQQEFYFQKLLTPKQRSYKWYDVIHNKSKLTKKLLASSELATGMLILLTLVSNSRTGSQQTFILKYSTGDEQYLLGLRYAEGNGVTKNVQEAVPTEVAILLCAVKKARVKQRTKGKRKNITY